MQNSFTNSVSSQGEYGMTGVASLSNVKEAKMVKGEPRIAQSIEFEEVNNLIATVSTFVKIEHIFNECNKLYFGGKLKNPNFRMVHQGRFIAHTKQPYKSKRRRNGKCYLVGKSTPIINFNMRYYGLSDDVIKGAIIHEMVHLWVYEKYPYEVRAHGKEFKECCKRLKQDYGIIVTTRSNDEPIPPYPNEPSTSHKDNTKDKKTA